MGFFAKQFVLYSAIQSGYYFISIVGIIASVISASYYLKIVRILFTITPQPSLNGVRGDGEVGTQHNNKQIFYPLKPVAHAAQQGSGTGHMPFVDVHNNYYISYNISNLHSFLISTLTLSILLFMLKPSLLLNSTQLLSLSLFYC